MVHTKQESIAIAYKLPRTHNKTQLRQHNFKERIARPWNNLPIKVVEGPTPSTHSYDDVLWPLLCTYQAKWAE